MTRDQHLAFCSKCQNRQFNPDSGIICSLTASIADFEGSCASYVKDETVPKAIGTFANTYSSSSLKRASGSKRFFNYVIDRIAIIVLMYIMAFSIGALLGVFAPEAIDKVANAGRLTEILFALFVSFIYYTFFESISGKTIGKLITGTRVVDINGNTPEPSVIVARTLSRWVPFEAFSFLGEHGWHDAWTDTLVVDDVG